MAKLTAKQQRFIEEYLIDLNATQAAIRAGYSVKTANEQGSQLLAKLSIQQAIAEKMAERSKRTGVNQDRVVLELAKIALNQIAARWPAKAVAQFFCSYIKKQWKPSPKSSIVKSPQPTIKQDRHYHCL